VKSNLKLLLNPAAASQIELFIRKPRHFLLLAGPSGIGKFQVSQFIGCQLLGLLDYKALFSYPYFIHIKRQKDKKDISIDAIRDVISKLKLHTTGKGEIRRLVVVENAQHMSEEAQNAFLKTLEEPPVDTVFILTVDSSSNLTGTVVSRARLIELLPVSLADSQKFFAKQFPKIEITNAWQISGGRPGLMQTLLLNEEDHELRQAVRLAKQFISQSKYERLLDSSSVSTDRESLSLFLDALGLVLHALQSLTISQPSSKPSADLHKKFISSLKLIQNLKLSLENNSNTRAIYLSLCLNLKV